MKPDESFLTRSSCIAQLQADLLPVKRYGLTILACFAVAALTVVLTGAATRDGETTAVQLDEGPRTLDEAEAARETVSQRTERAGKRRAAVRAARIERAEAAATAARERAVRDPQAGGAAQAGSGGGGSTAERETSAPAPAPDTGGTPMRDTVVERRR